MSVRAARRTFRLVRPARGRLSLAVGLGALAVLAAVGLLGTSGYLISKAALQPPILTLTVAIVAVRAFGISRALLRYAERLVSHDVALRALGRLRVELFAGFARLAPAGRPAARHGELLRRAVADVDELQDVVVRVAVPPLVAALVIAAASVTAGLMLPAAGVVLLLALVAAAVAAPALSAALMRGRARREASARDELTSELIDVVAGIPELVVYGRADDRLARLAQVDATLAGVSRREWWTAGATTGLISLATGLCAVAVLAVAIPAVEDGSLDGVALAALVFVVLAAFEAIAPLPATGRRAGAVAAAAERVGAVRDRPAAVRDAPDPIPAPEGGVLRMEGGHLAYEPGAAPAIAGVDLELVPGSRVALVGRSGSGKSTVAAALIRFVDLDRGRVTLGGVDVRELAQDDLRRMVRLSAQDDYLFATTIAENVRLARPAAGDGEVADALARAGASAWVRSLDRGLQTMVGEDGAQVSGGQRQRIVLGRALLSQAPLLILDEPTAHLDPESSRRLLADARAAAGGAGLLVITHHLAGIEEFDEIVVLEAGRVVERGTHRELLARGGRYAGMRAAERTAAAA